MPSRITVRNIASGTLLGLAAAAGHGQSLPVHQGENPWFADGAAAIEARVAARTGRGDTGDGGTDGSPDPARNVILFVGGGMGVSTLTAARILDGQRQGRSGEEGLLSFERFGHTALVKTYNVDAQVADSAGAMTAMMSGVKTDAGVVGLDERAVRGDCASRAGSEVFTALEMAEAKGLATGVVTTARLTDATPAATYAHAPERDWEGDSGMPADALSAGCTDIASQFVGFEAHLEARHEGLDVDGIDVAMGGGRRHFLPADAAADTPDADSDVEGARTDGRNLVDEWRAAYPDGRYAFDRAGFDALDTSSAAPVLALFAESHMRYEADRANDVGGEPSLSEMTAAAIALLDARGTGYLLVVESGRIEHAHRAGNAFAALTETIELSRAVEVAVGATDPDETLILVTADHAAVFTIGGYPRRGNPILDKVRPVLSARRIAEARAEGTLDAALAEPALAEDDLPYTTLAYRSGRGFRDLGANTDPDASYALDIAVGRQDLRAVDTTAPGFHQEALVPLAAETSAGEDVALHATGPGAGRVRGVVEQNVVFHVIGDALGLDEVTDAIGTDVSAGAPFVVDERTGSDGAAGEGS